MSKKLLALFVFTLVIGLSMTITPPSAHAVGENLGIVDDLTGNNLIFDPAQEIDTNTTIDPDSIKPGNTKLDISDKIKINPDLFTGDSDDSSADTAEEETEDLPIDGDDALPTDDEVDADEDSEAIAELADSNDEASDTEPAKDSEESTSSNSSNLMIALIVILAVIAGLLTAIASKRKKGSDTETPQQNIE